MEELLLRLAHHLTDLCSLFRAACGFLYAYIFSCAPRAFRHLSESEDGTGSNEPELLITVSHLL